MGAFDRVLIRHGVLLPCSVPRPYTEGAARLLIWIKGREVAQGCASSSDSLAMNPMRIPTIETALCGT
jgi:hypothetical protein